MHVQCVNTAACQLACHMRCACCAPLPPPLPPLQDFQGGEFSLFFANCEPDSAIDFTLGVSLYNVRGERLQAAPPSSPCMPKGSVQQAAQPGSVRGKKQPTTGI
jgi:hypothetical protein